jgi:hypothetical protein
MIIPEIMGLNEVGIRPKKESPTGIRRFTAHYTTSECATANPAHHFLGYTTGRIRHPPRATLNIVLSRGSIAKLTSSRPLDSVFSIKLTATAVTIYRRADLAGKMPPFLGNSTGAAHENKCRQRKTAKW